MNVYTVQPGITLGDIARRYGITLETLLRLNPAITDPSFLYIGQKIILPENRRPIPIIYTVRPGETLYAIARKFNISLNMLLLANPSIPNPNLITPGMNIIIPSPVPSPGVTLYVVQPGDTLYKIAQKLGTDLNTILQLNKQLASPNMIYVGQLIFVPLTSPEWPSTPSIPFSYDATSDDMAIEQIEGVDKNYLDGYTFVDMVPLANGWVILGDINKNKIFVLNAITGEIEKSYQLQSSPNSLGFDFDTAIILANQALTNKIAKIDITTDEVSYITTKGKSTVVATGENNIAFAYSSEWPNGFISMINTLTDQEIGTTEIDSDRIGYMVYDQVNSNLFLGEYGVSPSSLYRYTFNPSEPALEFKQSSRDLGSNGQDLAVSNNGIHVAFPVGSGNGSGYTIFDIDSTDINNYFGAWSVGAYPSSAFFSHDSQHIVTTNRYDVKLYTVDTHTLMRTIVSNNRGGNIRRVYFSRGDKIIYVVTTESNGGTNRLYFYKSGL